MLRALWGLVGLQPGAPWWMCQGLPPLVDLGERGGGLLKSVGKLVPCEGIPITPPSLSVSCKALVCGFLT